ncbi:hypothetical protein FHT79_006058 [Rhizobium sp. BK212]|nr:hypothetical protein [Rhizobium sp. BK212]
MEQATGVLQRQAQRLSLDQCVADRPDERLTQFGRALYELNIDIICANAPQAKGRVERANQTLQDRLVKELRLRGIDTIEAANAYAPEFMADFNSRFGKQPRNPKDMHRPLADHENLDGAMCRKEARTLSQSLTLRYDNVRRRGFDSLQGES